MTILEFAVVSHILIGLITSAFFKITVVNKLSKDKLERLEKDLDSKVDFKSKALIEMYCNQTKTQFLMKFIMFLLFMSGILAPIGFYVLNKEIGEA